MGWDGHDVLLDDPVYPPPFDGCSLMEQKTDWLKETSAELTRRLQDREASAQEIKRCVLVWTC